MTSDLRQSALIAGGTALLSFPIAWVSYHLWVRSGQFLFHDHSMALAVARAWIEGSGPLLASSYYEPIPPLFLGTLLYFVDLKWVYAISLYVIVHALTAASAYALARQVLAPRPSLLVGVLVGVDPVLSATSGRMYAENISACLVTVAILALARGYPAVRARRLFLVGVLLAACILARIQAVILTACFLAILCFASQPTETWRKRVGRVVFLVSIIGLFLSPLAYWNHRTSGVARISPTRTMHTLCGGALAGRYSAAELVVSAISRFSTGLATTLWKGNERLLTDDPTCGERWEQLLQKLGGNESAADRAMGKEVLSMIAAEPGRYALWLALSPIPFLAFEHEAINYLRPGLDQVLPVAAIHMLSLLLWGYSILLVALALRGTWILFRRRYPPGILVASCVWFYFAVHAPSTGQYRFAATMIPALIVLAVAGVFGEMRTARRPPGQTIEPASAAGSDPAK